MPHWDLGLGVGAPPRRRHPTVADPHLNRRRQSLNWRGRQGYSLPVVNLVRPPAGWQADNPQPGCHADDHTPYRAIEKCLLARTCAGSYFDGEMADNSAANAADDGPAQRSRHADNRAIRLAMTSSTAAGTKVANPRGIRHAKVISSEVNRRAGGELRRDD